MTIKTFHFFKTGTHTTMGGVQLTYGRDDLLRAAASYSESKRSAPLVPNHPRDDSPVLGKVKSLTVKGDNLYATAEFGEGLVKDVKAKRFKGVSAKWFRPDDPRNPAPGVWYLRHIGFLDGCNPAVKGLEPVAFAESWWDGSMVTSMFELEVAFSEAPQGDLGPDGERQILHEIAQLLMKRKPGTDYKTAAFAAHSEIEKYKDRRTQAVQQDPDRVAFHEAALNYQATIPGTTYQQAAQHILSLS